jgi:hypothetical protein
MRTLAVALAFCAALAAQPADDLDHLFHARQWFELRSAVTDRSPSLIRATIHKPPDASCAKSSGRRRLRTTPTKRTTCCWGIYMRSGQYRRWVTSYRQWIAAIPDSARARAEEGDEQGLVGQPDQMNSRPRHAVLRHDPGDLTIPGS